MTRKLLLLSTVFSCLVSGIFTFESSNAAAKKLTAEEVVARHIESIGSPDKLASIQSRTVYGTASVQRPVGTLPQILPEAGKRTEAGNFLLASADRNLAMVMRFYDPDYPGEHFAFDGKSATVSFIGANKQSVLGEFIDSRSGLMREGLLGGVLSTAWPLLNAPAGRFKLKYEEVKIGGTRFHEISYIPKSRRYLEKMAVCMIFDFESYRHVMTEYANVMNDGSRASPHVIEQFGNFRNVDGLTLPFSYSIECPGSRPYSNRWAIEVRQVNHNGPLDPQLFKAP